MCPFQAQDPLAIQDKYVTYPGSFRPGQDKFRLAPEVRGVPSPTRLDKIDNLDSQTGKTVQSSLKDLWHAWSFTPDIWEAGETPLSPQVYVN